MSLGQKPGKPAISSKINWIQMAGIGTAVASYVLGAIDAKVAIPVIVLGAVTMAVRSFATKEPINGVFSSK